MTKLEQIGQNSKNFQAKHLETQFQQRDPKSGVENYFQVGGSVLHRGLAQEIAEQQMEERLSRCLAFPGNVIGSVLKKMGGDFVCMILENNELEVHWFIASWQFFKTFGQLLVNRWPWIDAGAPSVDI